MRINYEKLEKHGFHVKADEDGVTIMPKNSVSLDLDPAQFIALGLAPSQVTGIIENVYADVCRYQVVNCMEV